MYYSQYDQDKTVNEKIFKNRKDGFFVDIGASDGVHGSNTLFFEQLGWNGICIEPRTESFALLQESRSSINLNCCVFHEDGEIQFREITGYPQALSGIVETYDKKHLSRIDGELKKKGGDCTDKKIKCFTLMSIMDKYAKSNRIDLLSIDTEGSEEEIIFSIDFDVLDIKVICVENNYKDTSIEKHLFKNGFIKIATLFDCDDVYVKEGVQYD